MKKQRLLATVALSLFLSGFGVLWRGSSAATPITQDTPVATESLPPMSQDTPVMTETLSPTPQDIPVATKPSRPMPTLILEKEVAEQPVSDLDGDGQVDPGDTLRYTISYSNTGQMTATNVILVDDYPENLIANITKIGDGENNGSAISWKLGILPAGESGLLSYEATLKETFLPGTKAMKNEASISSNEVDPVRSAITVPVQRPELNIAKASEEIDVDDDGVIDGGDIIKYKITYENKGNATATNVVIVDDYPETLVDSITNISSAGEDSKGTITWELGTVLAGAQSSLTYEIKLKTKLPSDTASVDNTVEMTSNETAPVRAKRSVPIKVPKLTIVKERAPGLIKDLNGNGKADPGDTIKYDIAYENKGDGDATEVILVDDYPETLIASITKIGDGEDNGSTISWRLGILPAGESGSLSYEATLKETLPLGATNVQNSATISSKETQSTSATATVKVEVTPTLIPEPAREPEEQGPATGIFADMPWAPSILIAILAITGMLILTYVGACADFNAQDEAEKIKLNHERIALVREGIFLIFIVSAVLILAIGRGIEADGAISILSAIAGYVFGRATK